MAKEPEGSSGGSGGRQAKSRPSPSRPASQEELDDRKSAILSAVVMEHIETAQPVGSSHVSFGVGVSSATVRSEMSALEREGFLLQPHTSAGRIPTDRGYRYFVDHLPETGTLEQSEHGEVRAFYAHVHGEVEELLERTSRLLAGLTHHASVVYASSHESAAVRSIQVVSIAPRVAVLVAVLADGAVEKRTIEFSDEVSVAVLSAVNAHLSSQLVGTNLDPGASLPTSGDHQVDEVSAIALHAFSDLNGAHERDHVFVGGSSSMAASFDAVETVRSVLSILEEQLVVVELIEDVLDRGLSVAIGSEHGFEPLAACALVVAPVEVNGEELGTIGVLGPTRMNYPKAIAAVRMVGEELAERLGKYRTEELDGSQRGS
jgi:heat-inducible transcriptional repressor